MHKKTKKFIPLIAISSGDPAGIGPEISFKAVEYLSKGNLCSFLIFAHETDWRRWKSEKKNKNIEIQLLEGIEQIKVPKERNKPAGKIFIIDTGQRIRPTWKKGKPTEESGAMSLESLKSALLCVMKGYADALVTPPVSKEWANRVEKFQGHTEYLASFAGIPSDRVLMTFITHTHDILKKGRPILISTITRHIPLRLVPSSLTAEKIAKGVTLLCTSLVRNFGVKKPKVGICSLNPHASDGGMFGKEESEIIAIGVEKSKRQLTRTKWGKKVKLIGPEGADGLMRKVNLREIDGVIAMFHDQAMIAVKSMVQNVWAGLTLGLPFIRTTPSHGTAFDIANLQSADASSMIKAIEIASILVLKKT